MRVKRAAETLRGLSPDTEAFDEGAQAVAGQAAKQCRPLPNVPGDHDYRRAMVPVYVRRTLRAAAAGAGPVHHI